MMILIQLNDEDDGAEDDDDDDDYDDDYLGSKVCQRCVMQRDQWGSHTAKAKPEGPRRQRHKATDLLCVCVCVCVCVCGESV